MDFKNLSLIELDELVKAGTATYSEIYAYFLNRANEHNAELNAFVTLPEEFDIACSRHVEA